MEDWESALRELISVAPDVHGIHSAEDFPDDISIGQPVVDTQHNRILIKNQDGDIDYFDIDELFDGPDGRL